MKNVIQRASLAILLVACALLAPSVACADEGEENGRPNVLILFADDQRHDAVGALGDAEIRTPNIDRLAAHGLAFTNCYIIGAHHGAVCMPSRAMLLTGRHYFNLPESVIKTWSVPGEEKGACPYPTFPELFRDAGYDTFVTGKWHNGRPLLARGFTHGDAIFFGGMSDHLKTPVYDYDPTGEYAPGEAHRDGKFSSEMFADAAIAFIEGRTGDGPPFLMYVSFTAPHDPRMAPDEYAAMYPPDEITLPPNFAPEHPFPMGDLRIRDEKLAPFPRTPEVVRQHIAAYYAMITHLDAQIGRILEALQTGGHAGNTIIIFAADNGLAVGQHGLLGKQNIYEHSAKVPLVICSPGIGEGRRSDALCYLHDVFPTLCELTGWDVPQSVQSLSLAPIVRGQRPSVRDSVFLAYSTDAGTRVKGVLQPRGFLRGVRTGRWKLIRSLYDGHEETLLFDLAEDPWEICNLADDPAHAGRVDELTRLLLDWIERSGDTIDLPCRTGSAPRPPAP